MTQKEFLEKVRQIANKDTSSDPDGWNDKNPLWGHCAVVSLLAQDYFGGKLIRASLAEIPKYKHLRSHFWNLLPNDEQVDFTAEQYADLSFRDLKGEERSRQSVLEHPDTARRYNLLKNHF